MRLHCDVEVQSRLLPTCGLTGRGRPSRALLALGRQPGRARGGVCLMVCTARDRAGVRYQVRLRAGRPGGFLPHNAPLSARCSPAGEGQRGAVLHTIRGGGESNRETEGATRGCVPQ